MACNRSYDVLKKEKNSRVVLNEAGRKLGAWKFYFAGTEISGERLILIASQKSDKSLTRLLREDLKCAVDTRDFLLFLDDLLLYKKSEGEVASVWVPSGRARTHGILLHPDDIYKKKYRRYGEKQKTISLDRPKIQSTLTPAKDGDDLGANWTARYQNSRGESLMLKELAAVSEDKSFVPRIISLLKQLRRQGAVVGVHSCVRKRERGYLMWGAFILSRSKSRSAVKKNISMLEKINKRYALNVDISWSHGDWQETVDAAKEMADAYDVVYATRNGALRSNHYDGKAVDFAATGLPSTLTLVAPDGAEKTFDLSGDDEPLDLSLSPDVVEWIEVHFLLKKLTGDYPHWDNAITE